MQFFKKLFRDKSKINHLKKLISMQKEIIWWNEKTVDLAKSDELKRLLNLDLTEAKKELAKYEKQLQDLES